MLGDERQGGALLQIVCGFLLVVCAVELQAVFADAIVETHLIIGR
jgi:hypothetical protein